MTMNDRRHYWRCGLKGCGRCARFEAWSNGQARLARWMMLAGAAMVMGIGAAMLLMAIWRIL